MIKRIIAISTLALVAGCSASQPAPNQLLTNFLATACAEQAAIVAQIPTGMVSPAQAALGLGLLCGTATMPTPVPTSTPTPTIAK